MRDRDEYYTPAHYERPLTRREEKQQQKLEKRAEAIRLQQAVLEEKHRAAAEKEAAKQARIQAKQDAKMLKWEEKEAKKKAKLEAKKAKKEARLARKERGTKVSDPDASHSPAAGSTAGKKGGKASVSRKKAKEKKLSAQKSIPYREMGRDLQGSG